MKPVSGSLVRSALLLAIPCSLSAQVVDSLGIEASGDSSRVLQERGVERGHARLVRLSAHGIER